MGHYSLNRINIRLAASFLTRLRGLLFAPPLTDEQGLLIRPCYSVHTFFMTYTIDVVFLDKAGTILKIAAELKPWRAASCAKAAQVLELQAGMALKLGLNVGDSIKSFLP